jgi:hypothetical protein
LQNVSLTITATESIQLEGRAVSLGSGPSIHVPTSPSTQHSTQAPTPTLSASPNQSVQDIAEQQPGTTSTYSSSSTIVQQEHQQQSLNYHQKLLLQTQNLLNFDMPPPTPESPSEQPEKQPRKRRRKREDPQNCLTNSEVR